jgi:hypothetical protein
METKHLKDCRWETAQCEYKESHHYCPHPEHACNCAEIEKNSAHVCVPACKEDAHVATERVEVEIDFPPHLFKLMREKCPDFIKAVTQVSVAEKKQSMIVHQDAFPSFDADVLLLLGAAVKFAGVLGVELRFIGKNGETVK